MRTISFEGGERRQLDKDLAHLVGEAGAKLSAIEDARTEMRGLKQSVIILAEAIGHSVTVEEVEASARRAKFQMFTSITAAITIIVVLGSLLLRGQALMRDNQKIQRLGTKCLILQQFDHLYINDEIFQQAFTRSGIPLPEHRPLPIRPTVEEINSACNSFLSDAK